MGSLILSLIFYFYFMNKTINSLPKKLQSVYQYQTFLKLNINIGFGLKNLVLVGLKLKPNLDMDTRRSFPAVGSVQCVTV